MEGFLKYVQDNNIGPDQYEMAWNMVAQPSIIEAHVKKAIETNTEAKKQTMNGSVYSQQSSQAPQDGPVDRSKESMASILGPILAGN